MGIGLSLLVAYLVLLATTWNWWSSTLGLVCGLAFTKLGFAGKAGSSCFASKEIFCINISF